MDPDALPAGLRASLDSLPLLAVTDRQVQELLTPHQPGPTLVDCLVYLHLRLREQPFSWRVDPVHHQGTLDPRHQAWWSLSTPVLGADRGPLVVRALMVEGCGPWHTDREGRGAWWVVPSATLVLAEPVEPPDAPWVYRHAVVRNARPDGA